MTKARKLQTDSVQQGRPNYGVMTTDRKITERQQGRVDWSLSGPLLPTLGPLLHVLQVDGNDDGASGKGTGSLGGEEGGMGSSTGQTHAATGRSVRPNIKKIRKSVMWFGYSTAEVDEALRRLTENNVEITRDVLLGVAYDIKQEFSDLNSTENTELSAAANFEAPSSPPATRKPDPELVNALIRRAVEEKKEEMRDSIERLTFRCGMCNESEARVLLLPCGHLASCQACLPDVRKCPRCTKIVRGTKEVYFV